MKTYILILLLVIGCIPMPSKPYDFVIPTAKIMEKSEKKEVCERCGKPATGDWSEVADEHNWRCDNCAPINVMPKSHKKKKLDIQITMNKSRLP